MKKGILFLLLTMLSYGAYGQETMGIRLGGGISTLTNLDRSEIFNGYNNTSVGNRFAWDIGISIQSGMKMPDNYFFQSDGIIGVSGATVSLQGKSNKVDYASFQLCNYFGKKISLGDKTRFFVGVGVYFDLHLSSDSFYKINTPDFILNNFKDFDFGAAITTGIEYERMRFSINPQIGLVDLTRDKPSVYSRSLKFAMTYNFISF